jgi:DNA uptake protein ComE-like DNA-binding protein
VDGQGAEVLLHCAERALYQVRAHHPKPSRAMPSANEEILDTVGCEDSEEAVHIPTASAEELEFLVAGRSPDYVMTSQATFEE